MFSWYMYIYVDHKSRKCSFELHYKGQLGLNYSKVKRFEQIAFQKHKLETTWKWDQIAET